MSFLKVNGKIVMSGGVPVKVPDPPVIQENKSVTPSFVEQVIVPDDGYDYIQQVTVEAMPIEYKKFDIFAGCDGYTVIIGGGEG